MCRHNANSNPDYFPKILLAFMFFSSLNINGQNVSKDTIFVDENFEELGKTEYFERIHGNEFYVNAIVENDTAIFIRLRYLQYFGELGLKKHQLNKYMSKKIDLDSTKIWVFQYIDTLPNQIDLPKRLSYQKMDSLREKGRYPSYSLHTKGVRLMGISAHFINLRKYPLRLGFKNFQRHFRSISKKIKRNKDAKLVLMYHFNKGYSIDQEELNWINIKNNIIPAIFSDGSNSYGTIIIYPQGEFYASSINLSYEFIKPLLKLKKYKKMKNEWEVEYNRIRPDRL